MQQVFTGFGQIPARHAPALLVPAAELSFVQEAFLNFVKRKELDVQELADEEGVALKVFEFTLLSTTSSLSEESSKSSITRRFLCAEADFFDMVKRCLCCLLCGLPLMLKEGVGAVLRCWLSWFCREPTHSTKLRAVPPKGICPRKK